LKTSARACVFLEGKRRRFSSPHGSLSLARARGARAGKRDEKKTHNNVIQTASRASTRKQTLAKSVTEEEEEEAPISFHSRRRAQTTLVPFKKNRLSQRRETKREREKEEEDAHPVSIRKNAFFKLDKIRKISVITVLLPVVVSRIKTRLSSQVSLFAYFSLSLW